MKKAGYAGLCGAVILCMAAFTGCGAAGRETADNDTEASLQGQTGDGTETSLRGQAGDGAEASLWGQTGDGTETAEGTAGEESLAETVSGYPKVARLPVGDSMQFVMYSEGCYCCYNGSFYGFMTEDGEEIAPFLYEEASPFSEGLACVCIDGKYGFIGKDGEVKIAPVYDELSPFTEGLAYFRLGEDYGFLDHEGNAVLRPDCDSISSFREGRAYFSADGLYGYLDQEGRIAVEPVYEDAGYFRDGLAQVMRAGYYGMIDPDGREVISPKYEGIRAEGDFLIAQKDGLRYCFDRNGNLCSAEGWDWIDVYGDLLLVWRDGSNGLLRRDGTVLFESEYESLAPIPEKDLVIARLEGKYGVLDCDGAEKIPFVYSFLSYDEDAEGFRVCEREPVEEQQEVTSGGYRERYGLLNPEGEVILPSVYGYLSSFTGGRAVVRIGSDECYGVIRRDGTPEIPPEYEEIRLYENGAVLLKKDGILSLVDRDGKLLFSGESLHLSPEGSGYLMTETRGTGTKYGFLDGQGEEIAAPVYDYADRYDTLGADNVCRLVRYGGESWSEVLIKTGEGGETGLQEVLLRNHITPKAGEYMAFLQSGSMAEEAYYTVGLKELSQSCRCFYKLYLVGDETVLYFCAKPYERMFFPMSDSGFFIFRNGRMEELLTGYECGGSMGGDEACFWYDRVQSRRMLGTEGSWGGFGGRSFGSSVYELGEAGAELTASCYQVEQTAGNYSEELLLENAGLFYDGYGVPYTRETVLEAEYVTEYRVDDEQTTPERYLEFQNRYRYMSVLDQ